MDAPSGSQTAATGSEASPRTSWFITFQKPPHVTVEGGSDQLYQGITSKDAKNNLGSVVALSHEELSLWSPGGWSFDEEKASAHTGSEVAKHSELTQVRAHDPFQWQRWLTEYSSKGERKGIGSMRSAVMKQTFAVLRNGYYLCRDGQLVALNKGGIEASIKQGASKMYDNDTKASEEERVRAQQRASKRHNLAGVCVLNQDCIEVGLVFRRAGLSTMILNMANASTPGGGYTGGSGAQEENLHRRTNLCQHLDDPDNVARSTRSWDYPLPPFGGVFSRDVVVFRGGEKEGYPFLNIPERVHFISVAADKKPRTEKWNSETVLTEEYAERAKRKIQASFEIAIREGVEAVVLSALGCGAYKNPPAHMARLMKEVIEAGEYRKYFHWIVIAIIEDHHSGQAHNPHGNLAPFLDTFSSEECLAAAQEWQRLAEDCSAHSHS